MSSRNISTKSRSMSPKRNHRGEYYFGRSAYPALVCTGCGEERRAGIRAYKSLASSQRLVFHLPLALSSHRAQNTHPCLATQPRVSPPNFWPEMSSRTRSASRPQRYHPFNQLRGQTLIVSTQTIKEALEEVIPAKQAQLKALVSPQSTTLVCRSFIADTEIQAWPSVFGRCQGASVVGPHSTSTHEA